MFKVTSEKETAVLAVPEVCADKIITLYHSSLFAGYQDVIKTYLTISNKFFIPNLIHYLRLSLLNLDSTPDIKVSGTFKEYYELLNKRLKYVHNLLLNFKSKRLAMINKDRAFFQYNSRDLVYIISPLTSQLHSASQKITIKCVGGVVIYKIIDLHNYLLMALDGKILRGLF